MGENIVIERLRRGLLCVAVVAMLSATPLTVSANEHEPTLSGHPVRIVAYILYPVGFVRDTLIFRPAHWLGSQEPFSSLFGHESGD